MDWTTRSRPNRFGESFYGDPGDRFLAGRIDVRQHDLVGFAAVRDQRHPSGAPSESSDAAETRSRVAGAASLVRRPVPLRSRSDDGRNRRPPAHRSLHHDARNAARRHGNLPTPQRLDRSRGRRVLRRQRRQARFAGCVCLALQVRADQAFRFRPMRADGRRSGLRTRRAPRQSPARERRHGRDRKSRVGE